MSITIKTKSGSRTTKRQLQNFTVTTPPGKEAALIASYTETDEDESGMILYERPGIATLGLTQEQLIALLPSGNKYGLPEFTVLYGGLKAFFDDQFAIKFPKLAAQE